MDILREKKSRKQKKKIIQVFNLDNLIEISYNN